MRRFVWLFVIILAVLGIIYVAMSSRRQATLPQTTAPDSGFPVTVTDALGRSVTIPAAPQKIISLAPSVTETLFAIDAGARVIANTTYCVYPEAAKKLPKIGGYVNPNIEKIVSMQPDLVVAARGNDRAAIDQLEQLGIPVVAVTGDTLQEVESTIRLIGQSVGNGADADRVADDYAARRDAVAQRTASLTERPRTLLLFSQDTLFSVGPGSHLDEMITLAGGRNVAAAAKTAWPELSMETVLTADPEIILLLSGRGMADQVTPESALAKFRADRRWRNVAAVKAGRVAILDDNELTLPGPRLMNGLEAMAAALHPELIITETPQ